MHEAAYWPDSAFGTLTYREEELPRYGSLDQEELVRFFKRLRRALPFKIRYYACGEYGEETQRPHYHVLLFGLKPCACDRRRMDPGAPCGCPGRDAVFAAWGHGGVDQLGSVGYDSARYCADYIGKAFLGRDAVRYYAPRSVPFQVMSQGIGRQYVDDHAAQLRDNLGVTVHGTPVGLPRYYSNRLEVDWSSHNPGEVPPSRRKYSPGFIADDVALAREQREKDLLARVHIFKKGKV